MTEKPVASSDLDRRSEIHDMVVAFYREVAFDPLLGPVFTEVAEVDWTTHIPTLIDYWCRVLLDQPGYDGRFLAAHARVHELDGFEPEHFDAWYDLFCETVDAAWAGPVVERAKGHAAHMAATLCRRLVGVEWAPARGPLSTRASLLTRRWPSASESGGDAG